MKIHLHRPLLFAALLGWALAAWADSYSDTISLFEHAGQSAGYFHNSVGYAVFPTIGKGGVGVGGAHGSGRLYENGTYVGDTSMNQLSVGWQLGGQAYSQIIFFQNRQALDDFKSGNFEFGADVNAVAITAAAGASAGTEGASAGASGGEKDARTAGKYYKGVAVFSVVKGGAMYEAALKGQKFSYKPRAS
jgi:lipid-binding SYLF domain-containing protein